jgi:hypothetical protein
MAVEAQEDATGGEDMSDKDDEDFDPDAEYESDLEYNSKRFSKNLAVPDSSVVLTTLKLEY